MGVVRNTDTPPSRQSRDALHKLRFRGSDQVRTLFADSGLGGVATVGYIRTGAEGVATAVHCCDQDFRRVEAKGLEPSNLLTASQALYQLSYAPEGCPHSIRSPATASRLGAGCRASGPATRPPDRSRPRTRRNSSPHTPTNLVPWRHTTFARSRSAGSGAGRRRAPTGSISTIRGRPTTCCACTPTPAGPPTKAISATTPSVTCWSRYRTMQGHAVLSPFGFDSFGLPAENAAIKGGDHPRIYTEARIAELKASVKRLGAVYDWRRELRSHDPDYMRWNQVIFLELLRAGLAYRAEAPVNWCPGCHTVLANEQVLPTAPASGRGTSSIAATSSSGSSGSRSTPRSCSTPSTAWTGPTGQDDAAQLDRPVRRRPVPHGRRRTTGDRDRGLHDTPDTASA